MGDGRGVWEGDADMPAGLLAYWLTGPLAGLLVC